MGFTLPSYAIVKFTENGSGMNGSRLGIYINLDGSEVEHVENEEGELSSVGDALIIVASASDFHEQVVVLGANNGSLDMGDMQGGEYKVWFSGVGVVETEISDVSLQCGRE